MGLLVGYLEEEALQTDAQTILAPVDTVESPQIICRTAAFQSPKALDCCSALDRRWTALPQHHCQLQLPSRPSAPSIHPCSERVTHCVYVCLRECVVDFYELTEAESGNSSFHFLSISSPMFGVLCLHTRTVRENISVEIHSWLDNWNLKVFIYWLKAPY